MTDPNATPPYDPAAGQPTPPPGQTPPPGYQAPPPGYQAPPPGQQGYPQQQGGYQGPVAAAPLSPAEDKQWAMLGQLGGILGWLPPLIIWLVFKDRGPLTNQEAKESLNFQITVAIFVVGLYIIGTLLSIIFIGFLFYFLAWAVQIVGLIFAIIAGVKVNGGGTYRYFFNFRFIK
ncbi:DUF4870 domain-containing protein [Herbiconiux sp. CPCC 203407]|uniref:DUF4870 domain-containing protein n=1 Tax=Herbiconiux oxytropis TaxID=2970915 RepID=A0AA41X9V6_9MICO|nr:DUF4870 domain-containing protein [Herbiconiux oxytropis]MCS5720844.1 DUF4870 domain-containing protein [Herbiconiux oxytropis]MCS5724321.1 DUF4870 domain-containing protein [Herbiconiux oxytropis]